MIHLNTKTAMHDINGIYVMSIFTVAVVLWLYSAVSVNAGNKF